MLVHELVQPYLDLIEATEPTGNSAAMAEPKSFCCNATADMWLVGTHLCPDILLGGIAVYVPMRWTLKLERERTPKQMTIAKNVKLMFAAIIFIIFILKATWENNLHCLKVLGNG